MQHLTMNTGHGRYSRRSEVADPIIDLLRPLVATGGGHIPGTFWQIRMVQGAAPGSCGFTLTHAGFWMVSCYLAWTQEGSRAMWPIATKVARQAFVQRIPSRPRTEPWLATVMMPAALFCSDPEVLMDAGDLERCVAWTALEIQRAASRAPSDMDEACA